MKPTLGLRSFLLGSSVLAAATSLHATNLYWDGTTPASWNTATNWSTVSGATTPDPSAIPGILDNVFFNMASGSGTKLVTLGADQSAKSLSFSYTGGVVNIVGGGAQRTLTLGTGGLTMAAGSSILFGNGGTPTNRALINLTSGAQTWTNNSTLNLTMANGTAAFTRDVGATLNFNKASTGNFVISNVEMPLVNGIAGNWAFYGTGANMRYATVSGGNITNASATTALLTAVNSATTNYSTNTTVSAGVNASRSANTIVYTGTGVVTDYNTASVSHLYTVNGILAVGASGTLTWQRSGGATNTSTMRVGDTNELVIAGQQNVTFNQLGISGATPTTGALTYSGTGTLTLAAGSAQAVSTYGGGTTVNSGTVTLSGTFATLGAATGSLTMNGGILNMSADNNLTVGRLAGVGGTINITNTRTLTVNQTTDGTYAGVIDGAGGAFTLGSSSTNKLTLSGTNNYTGATNVNGGQLVVTGAISSSSGVTVKDLAILAGESSDAGATNGKVSAITLNGGDATRGILAPGNGTAGDKGTLYGTSLAWNGATTADNSQMVFDLGTINTNDKLVLSGAMTKVSGSIFEWDFGGSALFGTTYTLVTAAGGFGTFAETDFSWKAGSLGPGLTVGTFTLSPTSLTFTAVPEPTSALAGLLIGAGLLRRRRTA